MMIDRRCERSARPEQDSIRRAQYRAHRDRAPPHARDCDDSKHDGVRCRCWL